MKTHIIKAGDTIKVKDKWLPITKNWLGESAIKTQGPFIAQKIMDGCVIRMSNLDCCLHFDRFDIIKIINYEIF